MQPVYSLAEVGKLGSIKLEGKYSTGQMFLHKVFGYRGVVLIPWLANIYDRDTALKTPNTMDKLDTDNPSFTTPPGRSSNYYQVLIDGRDSPHVTQRAQTESVTFLGNHDENTR